MKYVFSFLLIFISLSLMAQETKENKMYFSLSSGYSLPFSKSTVGSPQAEVGSRILAFTQNTDGSIASSSEKNPFGSRGAGFTINAAYGYHFSKHFGMELEFNYLRSTKILDASRNETYADGRTYFAEQHSYTNMVRFAPMLVVSGNVDKKFTPYAKFGILLPLGGKTVVNVHINDGTGALAHELLPLIAPELAAEIDTSSFANIGIPTDNYITAKTSGQFSLGFTSRFGCSWNISKNWILFGEFQANMLTIKSKDTRYTKFSSNIDPSLVAFAQTQLQSEIKAEYTLYDLPEIVKTIEYQNEITQDSNNSYSNVSRKDEPFEQLTFRDNYNSFGILLGFRYNF